MLNKIKSLGLSLIIGCMVVGCEEVENLELEDTKPVQQEEPVKEEKVEEPVKEEKVEKIKKPRNKKEREQLVITLIYTALEESMNGSTNLETAILNKYAETGKDTNEIVNELFVGICNTIITTINNDPMYEDLDIKPEEVCEIVELWMGAELATIDGNNLMRQMQQMNANQFIEKNIPKAVPDKREELPEAELRNIMETTVKDTLDIEVYIELMSKDYGIIYATPDYRYRLGRITLNSYTGEVTSFEMVENYMEIYQPAIDEYNTLHYGQFQQ